MVSGERFIVRETRGYTIGREGLRTGSLLRSSFAVLDTLDGYREIQAGRFYAKAGGNWTDSGRRRGAEKLAAELNEWSRAAWPV